MQTIDTYAAAPVGERDDEGLGLLDIAATLAERWKLLVGAPVVIGAATLGLSFLIPPTYTAKTTFLPPQQQQNSAASALASLGALAGLAGGAVKTPGDQYVALMQSVNVEDQIVERFKLMERYKSKYRFTARRQLEDNVRINLGKKDGLITVEADDKDPQTAADIANQYVAELRRLSSELALTEAQQRRAFFESEVARTKTKLAAAQQALQSGGFNASALKTEPKAAADNFARIKAEATSAEVKLQTMRRTLTDTSSEVQQQVTLLAALQSQLSRLEQSSASDRKEDADYIGRYREFKYQEALYELFSKQYEAARMDESRDGALLQVVDVATRPEYKSRPKRAFMAIGAALVSGVLLSIFVLGRFVWHQAKAMPANADKVKRLRRAVGRG